jgi:hypothetical protein
MIKYYKFGFGRVTDYVNEEIRLGNLSRAQGIALVERYDDSCSPGYIRDFAEYIGISVDDFWVKVRAAVNPQLFDLDASGRISRKFRVGYGIDGTR